jgi:hypothetical protein
MTEKILYISYKTPAGINANLFPAEILLVFNIQTSQNVLYTLSVNTAFLKNDVHAHCTSYGIQITVCRPPFKLFGDQEVLF